MSNSKNILSIALLSILAMALIVPMIPIAQSPTTGGLKVRPPTLPPGHGGHGLLDGNKDTWGDAAAKADDDGTAGDEYWDNPAYKSNGFWLKTSVGAGPDWTFYSWGDQDGPWDTVNITGPPPMGSSFYYIKFPAVFHDAGAGSAKAQPAHDFAIDSRILFPATAKVWGPVAEGADPAEGLPVPTHFFMVDPDEDIILQPEPARAGPQIDVLRYPVIRSPDAVLIAMQGEVAHITTDLIRMGDVEKLTGDGFTVTYDPGFHMGYIAFNVRTDHAYREAYGLDDGGRPDAATMGTWPLADVNFRHALIHCYDQESIVAAIYGYTVTPVQSLVPPSQGGWLNTQVRKHPYNPGDPYDTTEYDPVSHDNEDACAILRYGGYEFVDVADNDVVDPEDYWLKPDGKKVPRLRLFTPLYGDAPTSAEHGARFVADLGEIGLAASAANSWSGFEHWPADFDYYMDECVDYGRFDAHMVFWGLTRFPDHLYDFLHSSMDSVLNPGMVNHPGTHNDEIDRLVTILKTSLDHDEKLDACHEVQRLLYDPDECTSALPYMLLYSRIYFNAFHPNIDGIVRSPGYGSDNGYTRMNMHWIPGTELYMPDGERTVIDWIAGLPPEIFNPGYASTVYTWLILDYVLDGLMGVNPYTHADTPSMAEDWGTQKWATEEDVDELLAGAVLGSDWHEDWPTWSQDWNMTSWTDTDLSGDLTVGDVVDFDGDASKYRIVDMTWDIKVENKSEPYNELKLSGTDLALSRPPTPISVPAGILNTFWHEEYPTRSTKWKVTAFADNTDGVLSRSDQLWLNNTHEVHVDSVTVTIHLNRIAVVDESVGTGTGTRTVFYLDYKPVVPATEIVYFNGTPTVAYTMDYVAGKITFTTAPAKNMRITADYIPTDGVIDKVMEFAGTGMKVWYRLRKDVFWQDGTPYTAEDAKFNWLFLRDNRIPRYTATWKWIDDVSVVTDYKVVVYLNTTSQFLLYDLAGLAALFPPPVWSWMNNIPEADRQAFILAYEPDKNTTKPPGAGALFGTASGPKTQLYGTGPFIFDNYDPVNFVSEIRQNPLYFELTEDIENRKVDMFHKIGDVDYDGTIWAVDRGRMGALFGVNKYLHPTRYDPDVDVNSDDWIDIVDISLANFFFGDQRTWP